MESFLLTIRQIDAQFSTQDSLLAPSFAFSCDQATYHTEILVGTNVVFKRHLDIPVLAQDKLLVQAFDCGLASDEPIGQATILVSELATSGTKTVAILAKKQKRADVTLVYQLKKDLDLLSTPITFHRLSAVVNSELVDYRLKMKQVEQLYVTSSAPSVEGRLRWDESFSYKGLNDNYKIELVVGGSDATLFAAQVKNCHLGRKGILNIPLPQLKGQLCIHFQRGPFDQTTSKNSLAAQEEQRKQLRQSRVLKLAEIKSKQETASTPNCLYIYDLEADSLASDQVINEYSVLVGLICGDFTATTKRICCERRPVFKESYCVPIGNSKALKARVDLHSVKDSYTFGYKAIDLKEFELGGGSLTVVLLNTNSERVGSLKMEYTFKPFDLAAYAAAETKAREEAAAHARVPERLVLYDVRTYLNEFCDLTKQQIRFELRILGGKEQVRSGPVQSDNLRIQYKKPFFIQPKSRELKFQVISGGDQVLGCCLGHIVDFPGSEGVKKLQLQKGGTVVTDLLFKYSKLHFVEREYEEEQSAKAGHLINELTILLSKVEVRLDKQKTSYMLLTVGSQLIKIWAGKVKNYKIPVRKAKALLFELKADKKTVLGAGTAKLQGLVQSKRGKEQLELVDSRDEKVGSVSFCYEFMNLPPTEEQLREQRRLEQEEKQDRLAQNNEPRLSEQRPEEPNRQSKSIRTFMRRKLPQNFGDRIFEYQSASTMQNTIVAFSFSKEERFVQRVEKNETSYYISSSISKNKYQTTSFGFGHRRPYPLWLERNMKEVPAPNAYDILSQTPFEKKGKTFGLPYSFYSKVLCKEQRKTSRPLPNRSTLNTPGSRTALKQSASQIFHVRSQENFHFSDRQSRR